jgi:hypothetical protein
MNYKEATYKEKQAFEATLTTSQRGKIRKMEKEFKEQIQPINWASHAREEEVRKEAWATLKISERMEALDKTHEPRLKVLREGLETIQTEINQILEEKAEERSKIHQEPYTLAYEDPQIKAMDAIYIKMKEAQEAKIQKLVESFQKKVNA